MRRETSKGDSCHEVRSQFDFDSGLVAGFLRLLEGSTDATKRSGGAFEVGADQERYVTRGAIDGKEPLIDSTRDRVADSLAGKIGVRGVDRHHSGRMFSHADRAC